jgi:hypothetical protein
MHTSYKHVIFNLLINKVKCIFLLFNQNVLTKQLCKNDLLILYGLENKQIKGWVHNL